MASSSDISDLEHDLRRVVEGEVRFDAYSKLLYSTDASIYQVEPVGVVIPRHTGDVQAAVEVANRHGVPLLPRGGGTSLAGQTVNRAIILDFSPHMNQVLEVNAEELWCRVEPGLVQDELNVQVQSLGLLFGPDTSTSNRATLGGMIGNNSAGSHSIAYGLTIHHVLELVCVLADGGLITLKELGQEALAAKAAQSGLEGGIYRELQRVVGEQREEIVARYPAILRRVSGYNLNEFVGGTPWNVAQLVVGSEGTLATVVEAKMRLVPKPKRTALDVIHYADLQEALESSQEIIETGPYAVELTDKMILDLAGGNIEQRKRMGFVQGDPAAIMIVEYAGESEAEVKAKIEELESRRARKRIGYASTVSYASEEQRSIWKLRKAGLGLLLGTKGDAKPIAFVEDTAVDPASLAAFVPRFQAIIARHGARAGYYGHCSVGCLHIRPLINLKTGRGVQQMRAIAEEITELVMEFGGALSGEHGDGRARSTFNERIFGPKLYDAFRQIKRAWDPKNLMNPGNIVDAPPMTEHLRYGSSYKSWQPETILDFSEQGGFAAAVEMCNGIGVCRKKLEGTMCPSYMATLDEEHSTRGRANALRAVLSGKVPLSEFTGRRLYEVMDLCLECKACKAECPSNVDMAKLKTEFLAHYHAANGLGLRDRLFGRIETLSRWGSRLAPLSNRIAESRLNRWLLERVVGIDRRRPLPMFARASFTDWFLSRSQSRSGQRGDVILFNDTFVTYNSPHVGVAAVRLLERSGYRVRLAEKKCCGRPLISKGMLREARENAAWNVERLAGYARRGIAIVGLDPSCLLTLRDEYVDLLGSEDARQVAQQSFLLEEFLERERGKGLALDFSGNGKKALLHGHCHQKALVGTGPTLAVLGWAGFDVGEIDSGCCGMAGSFGFEREHYDLSVAIAGQRLVPEVKALAADVEVVAPGFPCRQQIEHLTGRLPKHPAELLWESLGR